MKINRIKRKLKRTFKKMLRYLVVHIKEPQVLYPAFVIVVSIFCIGAAQFTHGSSLRVWIYNLTHDEVVEKGIQYSMEKDDNAYGQFLANYRYQEFGKTDPTRVDSNAPMVALTFDDGPSPDVTGKILKVLKDNYSSATFFVLGTNAEKYPDAIEQISEAGCELGNHTYEHKDLTKLDSPERDEQLDLVNRAVLKATGNGTTVVRPPYGAYDQTVLDSIQVPVILWNLDTEDWESRNAQDVVDKVMNEVKDGDIILMHDIYDSTAEAVELLVPMLKAKGYQILSVSEMAKYKGHELEIHKAYGKIEDVQTVD